MPEYMPRDESVGGVGKPPFESKLVAKWNQWEIEHVAYAVALPVLVAYGLRVLQILAEHLGHPGGEAAVEEREIQLVVEGERAVVEVGAADAHPLTVHDHRLRVEQRRPVLVDLRAGLEHAAKVCKARLPHEAVEVRIGA